MDGGGRQRPMGPRGGGVAWRRAANGWAPRRREEVGRAGHDGGGQRGAAAQVGPRGGGGGGLQAGGFWQPRAPRVPCGGREPRGASPLPPGSPRPAPGRQHGGIAP